MLLSTFNAIYNPLHPSLINDEESIISMSCRIFRLYRKISYPQKNEEVNTNMLIHCVKKITLTIDMKNTDEKNIKKLCSFLSANNQKFVNEFLISLKT
jgi:hypothetical protein